MNSNAKSSRVLELYHMLVSGRVVNKQDMAERYGVDARSIQRDLETIRAFLSDQVVQQGGTHTIEYDVREKGYRYVSKDNAQLTGGEMLAVCKILLESRAFSKDDVACLLKRITNMAVSPGEKKTIEKCIANELYNYISPAHPSFNTEFLWAIEQAITNQSVLKITYTRLKNQETVKRKIWPVGILFSEYYFYLMALNPDKREDFDKTDDPYPTIYRIDRIKDVQVLDEHYSIPSKDRFKEGEYKNRVQYMFGGELQHIEFKYYGPSIEAVLDRLPMANVISEENGVYTVRAETFGQGILMWLLSQGSKVQVLGPEHIKTAWINEVLHIIEREGIHL